MFSRQSPAKRKHREYHDPDYPQDASQGDHDELPSRSKNLFIKKQKLDKNSSEEKVAERQINLERIKSIVEKEFNREFEFKQQQLEAIDERTERAKILLERVRYALVASYYKRQDLPVSSVDSSTLRGTQTLFIREDRGPQTQIHPSVKMLIGKKPKSLSDVKRSCPKRTAAQNAVQTIRAKSEVQKREERKLKQIIRGQGIVIDHSVEKETKTDITNLLNAARRSGSRSLQTNSSSHGKCKRKSGKGATYQPLVGTRLNNKIKHLIVVGNTSKSIVGEQETESRNQQLLTHKWLVYVQSKETEVPLERFVKKIRFHLHHSYRPNDIVDVLSAPFHVARRGWGEFPIRVQLFFHDEYHQKPVQLIHHVVLDKTLSGLQTLGAETLLEIWLRGEISDETLKCETKTGQEHTRNIPKQRAMSRSDELVDDNLLEFLNKIEATHCSISADIEKIQPTVVVSGQLSVKTSSPVKASTTQTISSAPSPSKIYIGKGKHHITTVSSSQLKQNFTKATCDTEKTNATLDKQQSATKIEYTIEAVSSMRTQSQVSLMSNVKNVENTSHSMMTTLGTTTIECSNTKTPDEPWVTKPKTTFIKLPPNSPNIKVVNNTNTNINTSQNLMNLQKRESAASCTTQQTGCYKASVIFNKDGKIIMPFNAITSAVRQTILPIVGTNVTVDAMVGTGQASKNKQKVKTLSSNAPKHILQKKLVQLVDSSGKVKYMQMLVAASSTPATPTTMAQNKEYLAPIAPRIVSVIQGGLPSTSDSNTKQISRIHSGAPLKLSNGNIKSLSPAEITMKPNIFKIVPENIQTKPQIATFCTGIMATTTTTITTVTSSVTMPLLKSSTLIGPRPSPISPVNTNAKPNAILRNLVFQKGGKVYIVDPLQAKFKKHQKKQVSLLKPQFSLLKQQMLQKKQDFSTQSNALSIKTPERQEQYFTSRSVFCKQDYGPQVHYGLKQQRINSANALQLMHLKRLLFEKQFLKRQFQNIRHAIEFLLRRLKLVVQKDSLASAFPFVTYSIIEFQSLTAFKQRACEWLRAKQIERLIRNHKDLARLNTNLQETFWTTKEIAQFARLYAYTPEIKSLPKLVSNADESAHNFNDIVKCELKHKQSSALCDTLSDHLAVSKWIERLWPILDDHEQFVDQNEIIDVYSQQDETEEGKCHKVRTHLKLLKSSSSYENILSCPSKLETEFNLVSEICRDLSVKLEFEELVPNIWHASTQTVLAQCLQIFLQKLVRTATAYKQQETSGTNELRHLIRPADIAKVLSNSSEFDFLTNKYFGLTSKTPAASSGNPQSLIKQEKL